jgi:hypothetical protein
VFKAVKDINQRAHINVYGEDFSARHAGVAALAAGRALLQDTADMNDASEKVTRAQKQMSSDTNSYVVGHANRGLLERLENNKLNEAVDNIRQREQQLEAVGGRGRVLLERLENNKLNEAVDNIRQREQQLEAVGGRGRVLLQAHGHGHGDSFDRAMKNTIKINAAADTVAQAFSRMAMNTRSRLNASELRNKDKTT